MSSLPPVQLVELPDLETRPVYGPKERKDGGQLDSREGKRPLYRPRKTEYRVDSREKGHRRHYQLESRGWGQSDSSSERRNAAGWIAAIARKVPKPQTQRFSMRTETSDCERVARAAVTTTTKSHNPIEMSAGYKKHGYNCRGELDRWW